MLFSILYKCNKSISEFCKYCVFFSYLCFSAIFSNNLTLNNDYDNTNNKNITKIDKNNDYVNILNNQNNTKQNDYQICYICNRYIYDTMFLIDDKTFCNQMCRKQYSLNKDLIK